MTDANGFVYLIHFARPYKHARHYLGWTDDLEKRMGRHKAGTGARLISVIAAAGIEWELVRVWEGPRSLERKLKNRKCSGRICPVCNPAVISTTTNPVTT